LDALSGWRLRVTTPADLPQGYFQENLRIQVSAPEVAAPEAAAPEAAAPEAVVLEGAGIAASPQAETSHAETSHAETSHAETSLAEESLDLSLQGSVIRRLAIYGPSIDRDGTIDLGILEPGEGAVATLMAKVRDREPSLKFRQIEVQPEYVQVRVSPVKASRAGAVDSAVGGLYRLEVEIPKNAPAGSHRGVKRGVLRLVPDHPRLPETDLKLEFAVMGSET
jgi:hypothetical protein